MKTIVTHISPDLDAVTSAWMVHKYMPGWQEADFMFVPAGETLNGQEPDSNEDVIHVDTGLGMFDHHQSKGHSSASKLVFKYLLSKGYIKKKDAEPLERMVDYVTDIDNFQEVYYPTPDADIYDFLPHQLIFGMRTAVSNDHAILEKYIDILEGMMIGMKNKISAEKDLQTGMILKTRWGKTIAFESKNEETVKLALKTGYDLAVRKDPSRGYLKIKAFPKPELDLMTLFRELKKADPKAHWSLQGSNHIIINGSSRMPDSVPTMLSLSRVIAIMKKV